jgi:predicted Zn finger-like uncharacterized protein
MKIVCDACGAKYSISDDKVQGKVFKIRCKKCSNIIVVRGGASAAEPAPAPAPEKDARVYDYGYEGGGAPASDEAVWHVVINQDQVGPMTAGDVQQRFAAGEIDADTYVWREGFADWLPLAQVDAFAALAQGSAAAGGAAGAEAVSSMVGTAGLGDDASAVRGDPGDLFAAAASGSRRVEDDGGDLFGGAAGAAASAAGAEAGSAKLRGERNENSVLFSLNNLAQLASDKPAPAAAAASPGGGSAGHATGAAGGEGSGLIDIRSMANAYLGGPGAARPATSSAIGSIDDLPVFGGGGFSEPAVIVPTVRPAANHKLMYALIGSVGLLAIAAVVLVVVMMGKGDDKPAQVAATEPAGEARGTEPGGSEAKPAPASGAADPRPAGQPASDPAPTEPAAPTPPPPAPPASGDPAPRSADDPPRTEPKPRGGATRPAGRPTPPAAPRPDPATKPAPAPPKPDPAPSGSCDEVSCVLSNYEGACCAKLKRGGSRPAGGGTRPSSGGGDVPDRLDRAMITEGVNKVKARVLACGDRSSAKGTVKVSVKVSPDGVVTSVNVTQTPDPALGSCVGSAMQRASFRKTASGGSFGYPWVF